MYDNLKELRGAEIFQKVVAVAGDVGEDNLGLSPADRRLLTENVNVVFHSAATLDFEATLKPSVIINLLGTRRVLQLCKDISHLKVDFSGVKTCLLYSPPAMYSVLWNVISLLYKTKLGPAK